MQTGRVAKAIDWDTRRLDAFRQHGFAGFELLGPAVAEPQRFLTTHETDFRQCGVYVIFAPRGWKARWLTQDLTNVIRPWPAAKLRERWVEGVELVYVGCAGRTASSRTLHKRIKDLLRHGAGHIADRGPHKGGERVWQCRGWKAFRLAWKATSGYPEPHCLEVAIGRRFAELAGKLPFANERL